MKKNKAIAIFCLLFMILIVFSTCTSLNLNKYKKSKNVVLAAAVSQSEGGGGSTNKYSVTNDGNESFTNITESSITCKSDTKNTRDNLVTKTAITVINNGKSTSTIGCVYSASLNESSGWPITCNIDGAIQKEFLFNNLKIFACSDPVASNADSSTSSSNLSSDSNSTSSTNNQTSTEDSSTQGANNDSGTVESGICDEPRLEYNNICASEGFRTASKIAGTIILFAKWIAPLLLIVLGMVDFGKAFLSGDDKSLTDATSTFIKRMIIAIIIPIVPGLLYYLIGFFTGEENPDKDANFVSCTNCLKYPLDAEKCNVTKYNYDRCKK